jgi:putative acyl-CoA dehydrogenase
LSCFLLPRRRPDGSKNPMLIQRLKDKLGNISNASAEVEYRGAFAWLLGEEGQGIRTIIDMVAMTRFDCMVGSSALMRGAVAQAIHHTAGRCTFGKCLHEHVLMQNVLADMALEAEAALAMSLRVAHALDQAATDTQQKLFSRLATPIGKYWICKRAPHLAYEAMESIGGVAYVEDNILPRIYREAPVNAIWEGSGNIQCLDVLRAINKEPEVLNVFMDELAMANGCYPAYDHFLTELKAAFADPLNLEYRSRALVDKLAVALQASVLIRHGENTIADAFVSSRIEGKHGINYGTLATGLDCWQIMKRAQPKV